MRVNNMGKHAKEYKYIVVRMVDGDAWYYGGWKNFDNAMLQAIEVNGIVVPTEMIEN